MFNTRGVDNGDKKMTNNDIVPELSNGEFESFISEGIVVVDFYADWCMPCLMMAPVVDELSETFKGKIKFGKINIDDNQQIAGKFGVSSIPNFVVFKDGKKVGQFVGGMSSEDFEERLRGFL
jgi:thioredoxin 1